MFIHGFNNTCRRRVKNYWINIAYVLAVFLENVAYHVLAITTFNRVLKSTIRRTDFRNVYFTW